MAGLVCLTCRKFLRAKKTGVSIEEGMPNGSGGWQSYKLWQADLYECPECGFQLVSGFGRAPIAEHHQKTYPAALERYQPIARVDDCGGARP